MKTIKVLTYMLIVVLFLILVFSPIESDIINFFLWLMLFGMIIFRLMHEKRTKIPKSIGFGNGFPGGRK